MLINSVNRIALGLEYDGSGFTGWQTQLSGNGVQDAVERALQQFAGMPVPTICAGRTDTGVHASYQVVHIDAPVSRRLESWVRGVNRFLPPTVAVQWAREVPDDFHSRFSATARRYDYWIVNQPSRSALQQGRAGWVFRSLDVEAMQRAATHLMGKHDFSAFRAAECQAASPIREVTELSVQRRAQFIRIRVQANAFLHHMVRNIVGMLVYVGVGRASAEWARELLQQRDRTLAAPTFSADGLYLTGVQYDARFGLPEPTDHAPF